MFLLTKQSSIQLAWWLLTIIIAIVAIPNNGEAFVIPKVSILRSSSTSSSSTLQVSSSTRPGRRDSYDFWDDDGGGGDYNNNNYDDNFSHNEGRMYQPRGGGRGGGRGGRGGGGGQRRNSRDEWQGNSEYGDDDRRPRRGGRGGRGGRGRGGRGGRNSRNYNNDGRTFRINEAGGSRGGYDDPSPFQRHMRESSSSSTVDDITDTNAHFYSKKELTDPSLQMQTPIFEELCQGAGITRPSRIQSLAWPVINTGKHALVADQTGSGKTLAYLLPLLKRALETKPAEGAKKKKYGAPKVLIMAPTAELADQIRVVCAKIAERVDFNTMVVTANGKYTTSIRDQIRMIQRQPIDVLISTPGRVSTILRTRNSGLDLTDLQTIVLDEVDILLIDDTFGPQLRTVGEAAPALEKTQFVFVTATLPDSIVKTVQSEFPGVVQVRGPGLHRTAPSLKETLVDVSVPAAFNRDAAMCFDVKAKQLLKALRQNKCRRTLVFCNTVESCRDVENLLNRKDRRGQVYEVNAYHNAMTPEARNANLRDFAKGDNQVDSILICTDRAARGVDFDASAVDHVVVFDFPKDPAEYVRRVGRTARAGRSGACTVFAHGWQLPVARKVMGTKADVNFKIAVNEVDISHGDGSGDGDDDSNYQFRKKHRKTQKSKAAIVKENIENGRLWDA